jgi:hypothetical protein
MIRPRIEKRGETPPSLPFMVNEALLPNHQSPMV